MNENECFFCGELIDPAFIGPNLDFPDAHRKCYDVWLIERETIEEERSTRPFDGRSL